MRLADDDRGRVPFALVGVVLLVSSATLATTVQVAGPGRVDTRAGDAVAAAQAASRTALHDAVQRAGRRAAARPLTAPGNSSWGRVVNDSTPYRDWLRIHTYLAARDALDGVAVGDGRVNASVSLPPVTDPESLRAAKRRVHLRPMANGSGRLAVRVENVTVTVRRDGRVVATETYTARVVASSPALALHDRVRRFERRADRGPLAGDGLGARLTARLHAVAWARGYAQYGGAPVLNVVANRHLALMTNGAILSLQRDVLGRSDRRGRAALARETARVGVADLIEPASEVGGGVVVGEFDPTAVPENVSAAGLSVAESAVRDDERVTVGLNRTADRALVRFVGGDDAPSLDAVLDDAYAADVRLSSRVVDAGSAVEREQPPPDGWTRTGATTLSTESRVEPANVSPPAAPADFHRLAAYGRLVVRERAVRERWQRGNRTRLVRAVHRDRYRVAVAVVGDHGVGGYAPDRPVRGAHRPGGPLDGRSYAPVRDAAVERLVASRGGPDRLARRAVAGSLDESSVRVDVPRPRGLRRWVYADLAALRDAVGNVSTRVERAELAGDATPTARLAARLRERRATLVDAPRTYDSAAERARVAARVAYLDRILARLDGQGDDTASLQNRLAGVLREADVAPGLAEFDGPPRQSRQPRVDGGVRVVSVRGSPPYLVRAAVEPSEVSGVDRRYHPLATRNRNLFVAPWGEAADRVLGGLGGDPDRVRLRTAARALRSVNRTLSRTANASLRDRRARLDRTVAAALDHVRRRLRVALRRAAPELSSAERRAAIDAAFGRWRTRESRALAASNGSLAAALADETRSRWGTPGEVRRGLLDARLRVAAVRARSDDAAQPSQGVVSSASKRGRQVARDLLATEMERAAQPAIDRLARRVRVVPAGLPVTPVPGYWYATANAWTVSVRGRYARFAVRAAGGTPADSPNATVAYVREAERVTLDADGDGEPEAFGRTEPVSFSVRTAVVVVVPPGPRGVGDHAGGAVEESPGWSAWNRTEIGDVAVAGVGVVASSAGDSAAPRAGFGRQPYARRHIGGKA